MAEPPPPGAAVAGKSSESGSALDLARLSPAEGPGEESSGSEGEREGSSHKLVSKVSTSGQMRSKKSVKEGLLLKQTSSFQRWKRRYVRIRGKTLYYAKDSKSLIFDEVDLTEASVAETSTKNINNSFTVITPFRKLILCAENRKEMEDWMGALKAVQKWAANEHFQLTSDHFSSTHNWYTCSHARPTFCNVCRESLSGVTSHGLSCEVCKFKVHKRCAVRASATCKWTTLATIGNDIIEDEDGVAMPHQWLEGNLPVNARCASCDRMCGSVRRLQDYKCLWCKAIIHGTCRDQFSKKCPLGQYRVSILPPTVLNCMDSDGFWKASCPGACSSPLLAFVNSKSGDNQGVRFLRKFKQFLNPAQVFDLMNGGPHLGLRLFQRFSTFRILVCGGDGSVGWVLSEIDTLGLHKQCQLGVLPLGTGNDLARVLGWGSLCDDDTQLLQILEKMERATTKMLDRWSVLTWEAPGGVLTRRAGQGPFPWESAPDGAFPPQGSSGTSEAGPRQMLGQEAELGAGLGSGMCGQGRGGCGRAGLMGSGEERSQPVTQARLTAGAKYWATAKASGTWRHGKDAPMEPWCFLLRLMEPNTMLPHNAMSAGFLSSDLDEFVVEAGRARGRTTEKKWEAEGPRLTLPPLADPVTCTWCKKTRFPGSWRLGRRGRDGLWCARDDDRSWLATSTPTVTLHSCTNQARVGKLEEDCTPVSNRTDMLIRELEMEPPAATGYLESAPLAAPAAEEEDEGDEDDFEGGAVGGVPAEVCQPSSLVPPAFRSKDQMVLRANSLKKALRQIIEQSEQDSRRDTLSSTASSVFLDQPDDSSSSNFAEEPVTIQFSEKCVMNNYFGIGLDAKISLEFNNKRDEHPKKCSSRTKNMMWYGVLGTKELLQRTYKNLEQRVQLECDGEVMALPSLQGIAVLNIPSYAGGINFWGGTKEDNNFGAPSFDDKKLEVVAVFGSIQMAVSRVINLQHHRIAQCRVVKITICGDEGVPVQVDGEAWVQPPGIIKIQHKNRAQMLTRDRAFESTLKSWEDKQKGESYRSVRPRLNSQQSMEYLTEDEYRLLQRFARSADILITRIREVAKIHKAIEQELAHSVNGCASALTEVLPSKRSGSSPESLSRNSAVEVSISVKALYNEARAYVEGKLQLDSPRREEGLQVALANVSQELEKVSEIHWMAPILNAVTEEVSVPS
ncbi:diacylglycerol kinase kappa [Antechinus flavipes]|uniref:diacylglycerol kinase kappa n=1 Tax=Antechinus flavipes TaxID=38775 RepID=UPI002235D514|nr:diacylglycerol kinase kappa [Antechinus flavipes]